jgi:endonuclease/exonuclease/phosphatase family metal-dependent hydrolase
MRTWIVPAAVLALAASPFSVAEHATHSVPVPQATRIIVDGEFADWQGITPAYEDSTYHGGIDLGRLWITNDEHYLFLRLEVGAEILVQEDNRLTLYIDTDDDPTTGVATRGIGAEVRWPFGRREGVFVDGDRSMSVSHNLIGLITAPTVTSSEFEIALDRSAQPAPGATLFPGKTIRIVLSDNDGGRGGGDVLPDSMGGVRYTFDDTDLPPLPAISLAKRSPSHLRVLSYNTNNRVTTPSRADAYRRILNAVGPDVLVLQEVERNSAEEVYRYLQQLYPLLTRGEWHSAQAGGEASVVISPFPITSSHPLGQSAAFVLDLRASWGTDLLLVSLSPPCCDRNRRRQREIDLIMAFVRDAKSGSGTVHLAPETPIVLVGDGNLVGHAQQRTTLLAGDIVNVDQFGPTFTPDWDGTPFADLLPRHTHRPVTFTWYGEEYSAGRLDYVVYSDAVMEVGNRFVLFTPEMPDTALAGYGLRRDDTLVVSDHLPVVADFAPRPVRRPGETR